METFILWYTVLELVLAFADIGLFIASVRSERKSKSDHIGLALAIVNGILIVVVLIYWVGLFPLIAPKLF